MKVRLNTLGGKLGLLFCVAGFAVIWAGWNGAASYNDIRKQFPYLVSGGIGGLALVVTGAALLIVQSQRADAAQLEATLTELRNILERMTGLPGTNGADAESGDFVVAGPSAYHRPGCKLVAGRSLPKLAPDHAQAAGLEPCRTCAPPSGGEVDLANPSPASGTRGR